MAPPRSSSNIGRSPPPRSIQYEREMSTATQPSSLRPKTTPTTPEQQGGFGNAATFASNAANVQLDRYKGPSAQSQGPSAAKNCAYKLKQMEYDLLGVGSHAFASGNIQDGPRAPYHEPFGCPHHCHINQESRVSLGSRQTLSPMDRFHTEGLSERSAILPRPDVVDRSMNKCSQCKRMMQDSTAASEDNTGA